MQVCFFSDIATLLWREPFLSQGVAASARVDVRARHKGRGRITATLEKPAMRQLMEREMVRREAAFVTG